MAWNGECKVAEGGDRLSRFSVQSLTRCAKFTNKLERLICPPGILKSEICAARGRHGLPKARFLSLFFADFRISCRAHFISLRKERQNEKKDILVGADAPY